MANDVEADVSEFEMAMRIVNQGAPYRTSNVVFADHRWMWAAKGGDSAQQFLTDHHGMTCFLCGRTFAQCIQERNGYDFTAFEIHKRKCKGINNSFAVKQRKRRLVNGMVAADVIASEVLLGGDELVRCSVVGLNGAACNENCRNGFLLNEHMRLLHSIQYAAGQVREQYTSLSPPLSAPPGPDPDYGDSISEDDGQEDIYSACLNVAPSSEPGLQATRLSEAWVETNAAVEQREVAAAEEEEEEEWLK
jgi:hypothetical protein